MAALLVLLGAGLMGPAGCALDISGLAKSCAKDAECDDTNPCTDDVCVNRLCENHVNTFVPDDHNDCTVDSCATGKPVNDGKAALGKKCGGNGTLACDGMGHCKGCKTATDCQASSDCETWICDSANQICEAQFAPVGGKANDPTPNDCMGTFCDGKGGTVETPLPLNAPCSDMNGGKVCDGNGQCHGCLKDADCTGLNARCDLASHACTSCDDKAQNGDETGIDCGGLKCGKCQGDPCGGGCANGLLCVDGLCCDNACTDTCKACNVPGSPGTCSPVAAGAFDPLTCPSSNPNKVCNGIGGVGSCKNDVGQPCPGGNSECYTDACRQGLCRRKAGDMCTYGEECLSNHCVGKVCQPCSMNSDCPSALCVGGVCVGDYGDPCASGSDCANGKCTFGLCQNDVGDSCTTFNQCLSGFCKNNLCTNCAGTADCVASFYPQKAYCDFVNGMPNVATTCQRPPNAYCNPMYPHQCQAFMCTGFPARCK